MLCKAREDSNSPSTIKYRTVVLWHAVYCTGTCTGTGSVGRMVREKAEEVSEKTQQYKNATHPRNEKGCVTDVRVLFFVSLLPQSRVVSQLSLSHAPPHRQTE